MHSKLKTAAKFLLTLSAMTVLCTVVWQQVITDRLYHCTDTVGFDFLSPGQWVHDPTTVAQVVRSRSMSEPDTIRAGWSVTKLWFLWYGCIGVSVVVSIVLARFPWMPGHRTREIYEQSHAA